MAESTMQTEQRAVDDGPARAETLGCVDGGLPRPPVSVVILTFNEELNIGPCIRSCRWWCDDIHVLDSGSTDKTAQIARDLGATVHVNKFKSFGDQRNWAIDNIACRHPWHFHLDADERFTPPLVEEMLRRVKQDGAGECFDAYHCPSKMILLDRWLRWSGGYPGYQVRLFRYGKCRFIDFGHGQREDCHGAIGTIDEPYMHYGFSKSLAEWFYKHNSYSSREAMEGLTLRRSGWRPSSALWKAHGVQRRREWKNFSYSMRFRWMLRFFYNYFLRVGFLDGRSGLRYSLMISTYEYWTELKIIEEAKPWREKTEALVRRMLGAAEEGRP